MAEHNFHETPNVYPNLNANLSNDQQFRLNKINEIKDYFFAEIEERELMSKKLILLVLTIVLSVGNGSISIASFATATGAPVGMMSASFNYYRICKKVFTNNKK